MPQLDFSMYASQGFWVVVFFCLLWAMLAIFITPKIADIQERRKRKIYEYVRKAEQLDRKAKEIFEKYNTAITDAQEKSKAAIEKHQAQMQKYLAESEAQMTAELSGQIASSEFLLAKEKQETLRQIEDISESLACEIAKKLVFSDISLQDVKKISKKVDHE